MSKRAAVGDIVAFMDGDGKVYIGIITDDEKYGIDVIADGTYRGLGRDWIR